MGNLLSRPLADQSAQAARPCQKETNASPETNHDEAFHDAMEYPTLPGNRKRKRDSFWLEETDVMTSAEKVRSFLDSLEKPKSTMSSLNPMGHQTQMTYITNHQTTMPVITMATPESEVPIDGPADSDRHGSRKRVSFRNSEMIPTNHQAVEERGPHRPAKKGHDTQEHFWGKKSVPLLLDGPPSELIMEEAIRQTSEEVVSPEQNAVFVPYVSNRAEFHAERSREREKERKAHQLRVLEGQKKKKKRKAIPRPMAPRSELQIGYDYAKLRYNLVQYAEDGRLVFYSPSTSDPADAMYIQIMDTIPCKKGCWIKTIPARKLGYGRELTQTEIDTLDNKLEDANCGCVVCADLGVEEIDRCLQEGRYIRRMSISVDHAGHDGFKHGYDQYKKFRISGFEWE